MRPRHSPSAPSGFTRVELLAVLGALALLALVVLPALAGTRPRAQQLLCLDNLRQIGGAFHEWGNDHGSRFPWQTPSDQGGTAPYTGGPDWVARLRNNPWFQWYWLSNELATPRLIACPSDERVRRADNWGHSGRDGLRHPNFQNNAVSYMLSLDSFPDTLASPLAVDRHLQLGFSFGISCSSGIGPVGELVNLPEVHTVWTNGLHRTTGNVLSVDGRAEEMSSQTISRRLSKPYSIDDNGTFHFLTPL